MLDQIFHDYHDEVIDGNEKLAVVYGTYTNTPIKWIICEDITVKKLVNRICDEFEASGYDLHEVPIDKIRERFITTDLRVDTPSQYIGLNKAKTYIEENLANFQSNEAFRNHPDAEMVVSNMKQALDNIILEIKGLL